MYCNAAVNEEENVITVRNQASYTLSESWCRTLSSNCTIQNIAEQNYFEFYIQDNRWPQ